MLKPVNNRDIEETTSMANQIDLEDAIFLAADKLQALCTVQSELESSECPMSDKTRSHYSIILEDQMNELRRLLEQHFNS